MNLLCIEFSDPHWIEVVSRVVSRTGAKPVYWTGTAAREVAVTAAFPGIVFHENLLAVRGVSPSGWHPSNINLPDARLLDALLANQVTALKMMDRMDASGLTFGHEERLRHYHRLVAYWVAVLDEFDPRAVLMPIAPHLIYDFVLYGLCKVRGIRTLLFDRTAIPGRVLPLDSFDGGCAALRNNYLKRLGDPIEPELPEDVDRYLSALRGDFSSGMAPNFKLKMERLALAPAPGGGIQGPNFFQVLKHEVRGIYNNIRRQGKRVPRNYLKVIGRPPEQSALGHLGYYLYRWRGIVRKARLRSEYSTLMRQPDFERAYVFVALHFQPERNTVPIGGHYANQLLLVALLARCLPDGWVIYVKEHGWQLQPYSRGQVARGDSFYADLAAMQNVQLVPIDTSSFELIDHAQAVATVSGSVGWEAINRGKPALIFGDAWYQNCDGVLRIYDVNDCRAALSRIVSGFAPKQKHIRQFIAALEDVSISAVLELNLEERAGITEEACVTALGDSFSQRLLDLLRGDQRE
jgi:hypothetical protein